MNLNEYKAQVLNRGFVITEHKIQTPPLGLPSLRMVVVKQDIDELQWSAEKLIPFELYGNEVHHVELRNIVREIDDAMNIRQGTNPNYCQHQVVNIEGKIRCRLCMAKLGERIQVDLKFN